MADTHDEHDGHGGGYTASHSDDPIAKGTESAHSMRKRIKVFIGTLIALLVVGGITYWAATWSYGTYEGPSFLSVQSASNCSGASQTIELGPTDTLINGGAECDMVGWDIDSPVVLVADNGYEETFTSAHAYSFRAARWRAANGTARVTAVFCPKNKAWNGYNACY